MIPVPAQLLAQVPGCESGAPPLRIQVLTGGRGVNSVWRVQTMQGDFVMRLRHAPQDRPGSLSRFELESHRRAAAAGLAPAIVAAADNGHWMLIEFVDAPVWSNEQLLSEAGIDALGSLLRRLHALEGSDLPRMEVQGIACGYHEVIRVRHPERAAEAEVELEALDSESREAGPGGLAVLNHGDLMASNLVGPFLVDWEYAQCTHPTWDVACLLAYYPALQHRLERLLEACGLTRPEDRQILLLHQRQFRRLNRLWQLALPTGSG